METRAIISRMFALFFFLVPCGVFAAGPAEKGGGPTILDASIIVLDLDGVNDASQTFDASVFFEIVWTDERVTQEVFETGAFWKPSVLFGNQQKAWPVLPEAVEFLGEGEMRLRRSIWGTFSQPLDLRRFPFDQQTLQVRLLSDGDPDEISFRPYAAHPSGLSSSLSVPDWRPVSTTTESGNFIISEEIRPVPTFSLKVTVAREYDYYVFTMILPLVIIVCMSFVAPWIEPTNFSAQITVSTTSMLTVITYRSAAVQVLPRTSYFTDMDRFIIASTLIVFSGLLVTVFSAISKRFGMSETGTRIAIASRFVLPFAYATAFWAVFT